MPAPWTRPPRCAFAKPSAVETAPRRSSAKSDIRLRPPSCRSPAHDRGPGPAAAGSVQIRRQARCPGCRTARPGNPRSAISRQNSTGQPNSWVPRAHHQHQRRVGRAAVGTRMPAEGRCIRRGGMHRDPARFPAVRAPVTVTACRTGIESRAGRPLATGAGAGRPGSPAPFRVEPRPGGQLARFFGRLAGVHAGGSARPVPVCCCTTGFTHSLKVAQIARAHRRTPHVRTRTPAALLEKLGGCAGGRGGGPRPSRMILGPPAVRAPGRADPWTGSRGGRFGLPDEPSRATPSRSGIVHHRGRPAAPAGVGAWT